MKIVTVDTLQGCNYEEIGIVSGSTIQAKNMFADLGQQLKGIVGGELGSYTGMMEYRPLLVKRCGGKEFWE